MTDLDLSKLTGINPDAEASTPDPSDDTTAEVVEIVVEAEEQRFQHYTSSRPSMQLRTTAGKKIGFISSQFITADQDCIDYLDAEIKAGIGVVTKGELLTSKEADPMEQLKAKHIAEYLAEQERLVMEAAKGITRDMGGTKSKEQIASGAKPMSTSGVTAASDSGS